MLGIDRLLIELTLEERAALTKRLVLLDTAPVERLGTPSTWSPTARATCAPNPDRGTTSD